MYLKERDFGKEIPRNWSMALSIYKTVLKLYELEIKTSKLDFDKRRDKFIKDGKDKISKAFTPDVQELLRWQEVKEKESLWKEAKGEEKGKLKLTGDDEVLLENKTIHEGRIIIRKRIGDQLKRYNHTVKHVQRSLGVVQLAVMEDGEAVGVSDSRKDGAPAAVIDGGKRITGKPKQAPGGFSPPLQEDEHAGEGGRETKEHHEHHGAQCGDSDRDSNGVPRCIGKGFGRRRRDSM